MLNSIRLPNSKYQSVENNDYDALENEAVEPSWQSNEIASPVAQSAIYPPSKFAVLDENKTRTDSVTGDAPYRTVSREGSGPLRHPTPDLQSLQGAYVGNVERLEQSAERMSLSSEIGEELKKMRSEQRRSDSRKSSLRSVRSTRMPTGPILSRQFSSGSISNSIIGLNNIARSGGFTSGGHVVSPTGSVRSPSWSNHSKILRSASQGDPLITSPESKLGPSENAESSLAMSSPGQNLRITNQSKMQSSDEIREGSKGQNIDPGEDEHTRGTDESERPGTAASGDTYRRSAHLFANFDGVHFTDPPLNKERDTIDRDISFEQPVQVQKPYSHAEPPPGMEGMIYYPAPVPMMLNLPQKLSNAPPDRDWEKRKSKMLGALPSARRSALGLSNVLETHSEGLVTGNEAANIPGKGARQSMANLPPQLRATMFFEHSAIQQEIELKGDSAVATLDSILDASAYAPVNAFVDHPFVGQVGTEVYGRPEGRKSTYGLLGTKTDQRKSRSSVNLLKMRQSSATILEDSRRSSSFMGLGTMLSTRQSSAPQLEHLADHQESESARFLENDDENGFHDAREEPEDADGSGYDEEGDDVPYTGAPTTLLAELQLRKQEQQQRNRTAATAFPNGMHSTLLELDAVAQVQQKSRKQKHVTLAWEDPDVRHAGIENQDDEDVPLGMLYPGKKAAANDNSWRFDEDRPLGLIAKREMEDNEPLSQRRARLRGEPIRPRNSSPDKRTSEYTLDLPGITDSKAHIDAEEEHETLAQRLRRLRNPQAASNSRPMSGDFASEVLSHFGGLPDATPAESVRSPLNPDETLGQRRKRLQAEREAAELLSKDEGGDAEAARPALQKRRSMADVLQAHPVGPSDSRGGSTIQPRGLLGDAGFLREVHDPTQPRRSTLGPNRTSSNSLQMAFGLGTPGAPPSTMPMGNNGGYNNFRTGIQYANPMAYKGTYGGIGPDGQIMMLPIGQEQISLDPKQRDMIDRWRQSVMY